MRIHAHTKLGTLLKHHPDALEAIITLSPAFKKLRNPILRKLMAGRTSISMAANIGHCSVEDFFEKLKPLGFEIEKRVINPDTQANTMQGIPNFLQQISEQQIVVIDVRAMLASGNDPLKLIQQKIKELTEGQALKIINSFEPTPLIKLLSKQGYSCYTDRVKDDCVETYFYKTINEVNPLTPNKEALNLSPISNENNKQENEDWERLIHRFTTKLQYIDVRMMEMPMPMVSILENLEKLPDEHALFVYHKRVPVFLLEELQARHFEFRINTISEAEVHLLIFK